MMRTIAISVACIAACTLCIASPAVPRIACAALPTVPTVDGDLNDPAWASVKWAKDFALLGNNAPATQRTRAAVGIADGRFFVAFRCLEENIETLKVDVRRDEDRVYEDDCVELFLAPGPSPTPYFHFIISAGGFKRDEKGQDEKWNSSWRAAAKIDKHQWTAEMAIPLENLPLTAAGLAQWRVNFCRAERPKGELSSWAPCDGGFHEPERFGVMTLEGIDIIPVVARSLARDARALSRRARRIQQLASEQADLSLARRIRVRARRSAREADDLAESLERPGLSEARIRSIGERLGDLGKRVADTESEAARLAMIAAAGEDALRRGYLLCRESTMWKLKKGEPYAGQPVDDVTICLARGEYEPAQIVVVPIDRDLTQVRISVGDLVGKGGTIPSSEVTVNVVGYVHVTSPSGHSVLGAGWCPDPLLDNGPVNIPRAGFRPFWITVHAPRNAAAGDYVGKLTVSPGNASPAVLPLRVHVWDFEIPLRTHLRNWFQLNTSYIAQKFNIPTSPADVPGWNFSQWVGADAQGRKNYFGSGDFAGKPDDTTSHSGRRSLRVTATNLMPGAYEHPRAGYHTSGPLQLKPNTQYELTVWYRTRGITADDAVEIAVGGQWGREGPAEDWTKVTRRFQTGQDGATYVYLRLFAEGTVWFDDIRLVRTDDPEKANIMPNGDFEAADYEEGQRIIREFRLNALRHRCSDLNVARPDITVDPTGRVHIDWTRFDREIQFYVNHGLSGFNISWARLPGGWGKVESVTDQRRLEQAKDILRQTQKHLQDKGWLDLAYVYTIDEPGRDYFPQVKKAFAIVKEAAPKLKTLLTFGYGATRPWRPGEKGLPAYADLAGYIDIWVPHIDCFDPAFLDTRRKLGEEIWEYVCISAQRPYPNIWGIDYPGIDHKMVFWQCWRYNIGGFLYWAVTYWKQDPWTNPMTYPGGNADGSLLYYDADGPVNSIRWELVRDGIEDYDMMVELSRMADQLEKRGGHGALVAKARKALDIRDVCASFAEYTQDPEQLDRRRMQIGEIAETVARILNEG